MADASDLKGRKLRRDKLIAAGFPQLPINTPDAVVTTEYVLEMIEQIDQEDLEAAIQMARRPQK